MEEEMNHLELASYILIVVGAVNWALVGLSLFETSTRTAYNPVYLVSEAIGVTMLEPVIYLLVGLAGLYQIYFGYRMRK